MIACGTSGTCKQINWGHSECPAGVTRRKVNNAQSSQMTHLPLAAVALAMALTPFGVEAKTECMRTSGRLVCQVNSTLAAHVKVWLYDYDGVAF